MPVPLLLSTVSAFAGRHGVGPGAGQVTDMLANLFQTRLPTLLAYRLAALDTWPRIVQSGRDSVSERFRSNAEPAMRKNLHLWDRCRNNWQPRRLVLADFEGIGVYC